MIYTYLELHVEMIINRLVNSNKLLVLLALP